MYEVKLKHALQFVYLLQWIFCSWWLFSVVLSLLYLHR